ncbi:hypothetical protein M092_2690 [Parabacteroides distasonis str. 3776 D15 iv]|uniref:DUF6383 domain-containing protein n=1 Tax=Parabacteroides distasonis TaxID=823 RepID=UPI0004D992AB|nr:DUF6383 domain-containing protein [Parabacteroides distasonis]KDS70590.1 hypothetical protein M092_2690 [Parabacteroides distasonis str. 3776 D15 iv]
MNKKFTTFLASAMLATAFSAGAQVDAKKGDVILLGTESSKYLTVETGEQFGKLNNSANVSTNLSSLNKATWTVSAKKTSLGKYLYSFVNKATSLTLAVDPATAYNLEDTKNSKKIALTLGGGSATEWVSETVNNVNTIVSYNGDYILAIADDPAIGYYLVKAKTLDKLGTVVALKSEKPSETPMPLDADDLNTLLQSVETDKPAELFFGLNMDPEVTKGQSNLMTATALNAQNAGNGYVYLQAKDQKFDGKDAYVVVDTAYYGGTESDKLLKYTYDHMEYADKAKRLDGSYKFKFSYNAAKEELYVQVAEVAHEYKKGDKNDDQWKAFLKENNNSTWTQSGTSEPLETVKDEYIYMSQLNGMNVLTVNVAKDEDGVGTRKGTDGSGNKLYPVPGDQNVKVTIGTKFTGLTLTTIPNGVYTIQYKSTGGNQPEKNGTYALANLAGSFGWTYQAKRQDFNHIPAAQWVVEKNGTSNTATVNITNREFNDRLKTTSPLQFFKVEGSDDVFCFYGYGTDTLSFKKVADELVADKKLGYKYVSADEAKVQTYTFNYLHGLALDKYLYTPAGKDSIVRVDENDGKSNFRLELVVENDTYGVGDTLVRNVYYVYNAVNGEKRYLSYDGTAKKYMMKKNPTPFFLKENNCIDGKHYYALVEADICKYYISEEELDGGDNIVGARTSYKYKEVGGKEVKITVYLYPFYDKDGNCYVNDNSKDAAYFLRKIDGKTVLDKEPTIKEVSGSSTNYASLKVSVDDNTLDLTEGDLNDKLNGQNEIRTSAFAVEIDDSPLYRRFNNVALGENETADSLYFVEKTRGEYLMDEWNKNLLDKDVDYAGIWNKEKANGKLAFIIDSVWVNRGLGNIKPQYLVSVARNDQAGTPGVPCTYEHNHFDNAGHQVSAAECSHATKAHAGFHYGKYLVSFGDSAMIKDHELETPYMDIDGGYTRVGFVKAIHAGDSLFILVNEFKDMDPAKLDVADIIDAYTKAKINTKYIVNLQGDNHKNVTWSFRYVTPSNVAGVTAEEGEANEFLFESNIYNEGATSTLDDVLVDSKDKSKGYISLGGKATKGYNEAVAGSIAPSYAAWLKMQNGCLVLTRGDSKFDAAKTGSDGALIFNAYQKTDAEDMVTSIEGANAEGVSIVAGNGTVTVQGAAGKSIVITNILGKVVAETVLPSDNATIAVPAGIVAVAVDGEEAVKAIVK